MIYKGILCLVYPFYLDFASVVSSCSNRIIVSLFRMLLYVGVHSASNRIHPSFSYIMSSRDVVIHVTCLHWRHFVYEMKIWLKKGSYRKSKARQSELGLCKLKFSYTNFNENRSRTPLLNQLKISCTLTYILFLLCPLL